MTVEKLRSRVRGSFAWNLLGESGSPLEGRKELMEILISVHNDAIDLARLSLISNTYNESSLSNIKIDYEQA